MEFNHTDASDQSFKIHIKFNLKSFPYKFSNERSTTVTKGGCPADTKN